jgi:hypothetical protein
MRAIDNPLQGALMYAPKPTEQHQRLAALAGTWDGDETLYPSPWDPAGGTARAEIVARVDIDGFFLITDYVEWRDGKVSYRGHGVIGWDAEERCYTMHWFDSMGGSYRAPATGTWEGDRLSFTSETGMGRTRYTYEFDLDGRYTFKMESTHEHEGAEVWKPTMKGIYTRR